ncbi:MAG TPA: hypothetical protein VGJ15_13190 [Pirellulales bacterium]|jgi:hypothetical protein
MAEPWFDPVHFGAMYGSIGGGICGALGALIGTCGGILAPRGKGKTLVLGLMYLTVALGVAQLLFGIYALCAGQPWAIWYGPVLCGFIATVVVTPLIPMFRMRYRQAEERRIEAEALRNG